MTVNDSVIAECRPAGSRGYTDYRGLLDIFLSKMASRDRGTTLNFGAGPAKLPEEVRTVLTSPWIVFFSKSLMIAVRALAAGASGRAS